MSEPIRTVALGQVFIGGELAGRLTAERNLRSSEIPRGNEYISSYIQFKERQRRQRNAKPTYAENLRAALAHEAGRYMSAWWTGSNPYMASGKAKRILRLKRYLARIQRLEGM